MGVIHHTVSGKFIVDLLKLVGAWVTKHHTNEVRRTSLVAEHIEELVVRAFFAGIVRKLRVIDAIRLELPVR